MDFIWIQSYFSNRGKAIWLYRRGRKRAKAQNHAAAIDDYSMSISMSRIPVEVRAMALYYRAKAHLASGNAQKGTDDFDTILSMEASLVNVKTLARQNLARMYAESHTSL